MYSAPPSPSRALTFLCQKLDALLISQEILLCGSSLSQHAATAVMPIDRFYIVVVQNMEKISLHYLQGAFFSCHTVSDILFHIAESESPKPVHIRTSMYVCTYVGVRMHACIYLFIYCVYLLVRVLSGKENLWENNGIR